MKMEKQQLQNGVMSIGCCEQNSVPADSTFLGCSLCKQRYSEPKILPCLHTFCRHCLDAYTPPHSLSVMCPTCRQQSIVPPEGVLGLQDSGFVLRLMEFIERCQKCSECIGSSPAMCEDHTCAGEQDLMIRPLVSCHFFMVALCNRETIYIFILFLLSSSIFFFPRLISAVGDWMFTILWHMVWP